MQLLCTSHPFFTQVQGQMLIRDRQWCDLVVYMTKGISIEFDREYWVEQLLPKLTDFYNTCSGPEIVSPIQVLGLPVCNFKQVITMLIMHYGTNILQGIKQTVVHV